MLDLSWGMWALWSSLLVQTLSYSMRDIVPWPRIEPRPPALQSMESQPLDHQGSPGMIPFFEKHFLYTFTYIYIEREREREKAMAPHSSTLAWKIPWMEEPGRLQSMGSLRVRHDWATSLSLFTFTYWRRKWQPTPVFLPGESQGWGSLVGLDLWGRTESDTTEAT